MKFISWNVNGLRACCEKGFDVAFRALSADFVCLQETKMQEGQLDLEFAGYHSYWNYAEKKGYSGTAIFSHHEALSVIKGIGIEEHDHEGRVLTIELPEFYLVNVYVPNAQEGLKRMEYRLKWEDDFRAFLKGLEAGEHARAPKPVIVCGDFNVAHEEIDLKNPSSNRHNPGFTDDERAKMTALLESGFVDVWRELYPNRIKYSWWSYRARARERNIGWRIDYFLVSEALRDKISDADIHDYIFGSDHCPVELSLSLENGTRVLRKRRAHVIHEEPYVSKKALKKQQE